MTKRTLNQNAKYVQELIDLIEPDFKFFNKPRNRLKTVSNDLNSNLFKINRLSQLKKDIDSIETDCGHIFCEKCIKIWIEQNNQCPYCRMSLVEKENKVVFKDDPVLGDLINGFKSLTESVDFKVWKIYVDSSTMGGTIYAPIKSEKSKFENLVNSIKETIHKIKKHIVANAEKKKYSAKQVFVIQRLWEYFYYSYVDIFADISYGYCITVHKSQGSTYNNVYVDVSNILKYNRDDIDGLKCLYTSIT